MNNFDDMNVEPQLQVANSENAQLRDQIDALNRTGWSLEERDAALLSAKSWRGKNFGRKSERDACKGKDDDNIDEASCCRKH